MSDYVLRSLPYVIPLLPVAHETLTVRSTWAPYGSAAAKESLLPVPKATSAIEAEDRLSTAASSARQKTRPAPRRGHGASPGRSLSTTMENPKKGKVASQGNGRSFRRKRKPNKGSTHITKLSLGEFRCFSNFYISSKTNYYTLFCAQPACAAGTKPVRCDKYKPGCNFQNGLLWLTNFQIL